MAKKVVKSDTEKVAKLAKPGKYVYYFQYITLEKTTKADRDLFDSFIKSVTLPTKGAVATGSAQST